MKLTNLHVQNYRALRDVEIPLSHFGCLIGENNAGKSTVLQTLSLFFSGSKLGPSDFFDEGIETGTDPFLTVEGIETGTDPFLTVGLGVASLLACHVPRGSMSPAGVTTS